MRKSFFSSCCHVAVNVLCLFSAMLLVSLQYAVFPDHINFLLNVFSGFSNILLRRVSWLNDSIVFLLLYGFLVLCLFLAPSSVVL